jgi:histone-lysine N-methyltransferase ASH1L
MESQATPFGASTATPATPSVLNLHATTSGRAGDSMGLDYSEQLLTPENSRSETSSNTENAPNDEKSTLRRRSTRVTRASLQKTTQPGDSGTDKNNESTAALGNGNHNGASEALIGATDGKKAQSSLLRHSLAVMESSQWSDITPTLDDASPDGPPLAPDTPVSSSSQEPQAADMNTSLQQRTLRKRVESALVKQESPDGEKAATSNSVEKTEPPRRSSRLSLLGRTSGIVERAGSVLGKRSRELMEMGKEVSRRTSLRPRNVIKPKEENAAAAANDVPAKKRRVSASDVPDSKGRESTDEPIKPIPRYKPKRWLSHGLYIGQEPTDSPPRQNRGRTTRRRAGNRQRKFLPMPMFSGARLLANGRDFKLPFDVFSPLPPGQPKPDEWRKTNKSMTLAQCPRRMTNSRDRCFCRRSGKYMEGKQTARAVKVPLHQRGRL